MGIHSDVEPTIVIWSFPSSSGGFTVLYLHFMAILWGENDLRQEASKLTRWGGLKGWNVVSAWRSYMEYRGPQTDRTVF